MTWPLPLTVIEKLLLAEDRPGYSWSVFFRLRFSKRLNEAAARAAVLAVLPRHPLLCSLVRRTFLGGWQWIEAENKTPLILRSRVMSSTTTVPVLAEAMRSIT